MNDITKEELIFGSTIVQEIYCEFIDVPLTKKEKRKRFIYKYKEVAIEILWLLFFIIGVSLQIGSLALLAGLFFIR